MPPPRPAPARRQSPAAGVAVLVAALLAACSAPGPVSEPHGLGPSEARALVARLLPDRVRDKPGWAADIHAALSAQELPSTPAHLCAVMAVAEQESGFQADPPVPGLAGIARQEIDRRADRAGVPALAVRAALALKSPDGRSYAERLDAVKTERELSVIFEDFIGMVPLGKTFLADSNPVRTGGPMQVSIAFAEAQVRQRRYPYELKDSVRHEVFTRRGGLYFGAAHLLDYRGPYEQMIFRFADFNAGRWASRNAGFQAALALASGLPVTPDGDLLPHGGGAAAKAAGETERAAYSLAGRLGLDEAAMRRDLARGDEPGFEKTVLHQRVFAYAERLERRALPRAVLPRIDLQSPKITRKLSTEWFARRVDERYRRCLARAEGAAND
ncbi:MAG: DUF1615 domain-containing protein [Proteobacteria bacterium]|nr:DUF1615 domain-containing protein [Pseudomonadota bacterium]